jgi:hypothetical protein
LVISKSGLIIFGQTLLHKYGRYGKHGIWKKWSIDIWEMRDKYTNTLQSSPREAWRGSQYMYYPPLARPGGVVSTFIILPPPTPNLNVSNFGD